MPFVIDRTPLTDVPPTSPGHAFAVEAEREAEIDRILAGRQPRLDSRVKQETIENFLEGNGSAAADIANWMQDYQRLPWARWLFDMGAPTAFWAPALDLGLTQTHWNRAIEHSTLLRMLARLRQERGLGLPVVLTGSFEIFRGGDPDGISWTVDREVAEAAARSHRMIYGTDDGVHRRRVTRDEVLYYTNTRNEHEVIVDRLALGMRMTWQTDSLSRKWVRSKPNEGTPLAA